MSENKKKENAEIEKKVESKPAINKGTKIILGIIIFSLIWYLLSDRFTPYTSQARVNGYVVGVAPKVSGLVTDVWIQNNHEVKKGQKLLQIDQSQYLIALEKANSDLETQIRQVDAGTASVEAAKAKLLAAKASKDRAEKDANRLQRLYDEDPGTISTRRLETSLATLEQTKAAVAAAKAGIKVAIEKMGGEDDSNNAILKAAMSVVEKAELDLQNTIIKAASDGIITDLSTEIGRFASTGAPVLTLISYSDLWVTAEFTENNLGNLKKGSEVEILFDVLPGSVFKGSVSNIGVGVSAGTPHTPGRLPTIKNDRDWLRQSQRFPVNVKFDINQCEELSEQLRIGGQATVIGYTDGCGILNFMGMLYIRIMSIFSYAY